MEEHLIPYFNIRQKNKIDVIVIHSSAQTSIDDLINVLEKRELSAHYLISQEGKVIRLVEDKYRAWHAGAGLWNGERDINSNSIGIELCNPLFGEAPYPKEQMHSLKELCLELMEKYNIPSNNVIGHSDMAPTRKIDPGTMLDWQYLSQHGIGLWYDKSFLNYQQINDIKSIFEEIGYGTEDIKATQWAFLRHYNPELYYFLGGKKGSNEGIYKDFSPENNPEFLRTLAAVRASFNKYKQKNIIDLNLKKISNYR